MYRNVSVLENIQICVSANPETIQVYLFKGAGGVFDQLVMKQKKDQK